LRRRDGQRRHAGLGHPARRRDVRHPCPVPGSRKQASFKRELTRADPARKPFVRR
jgi:hypothetical protein